MFNSGNLKLDLLHNFFLESGARMGKIRVYEATQNPVAREMVGYLIVRGGVHHEAYAKALSDLSGVDVTKLLPVPEVDSDKFPDARKYMEKGFHRILYRSRGLQADRGIWNGLSAIDGSDREVEDGPPEGGEVPELESPPSTHRTSTPRRSPRDTTEHFAVDHAKRSGRRYGNVRAVGPSIGPKGTRARKEWARTWTR